VIFAIIFFHLFYRHFNQEWILLVNDSGHPYLCWNVQNINSTSIIVMYRAAIILPPLPCSMSFSDLIFVTQFNGNVSSFRPSNSKNLTKKCTTNGDIVKVLLWHLNIVQVQKAVDGTWYAYLHDHGISDNIFVDEHTGIVLRVVVFPK
jgi:hypothetical protein